MKQQRSELFQRDKFPPEKMFYLYMFQTVGAYKLLDAYRT